MGKRLARLTDANAPRWQPVTILAIGHGVVIFQCVICGDVHFMDVDAETEAALRGDSDV